MFYFLGLFVVSLMAYKIYQFVDYLETIRIMNDIQLSIKEGIMLDIILERYIMPVVVIFSIIGFVVRKTYGWIGFINVFYVILFHPFLYVNSFLSFISVLLYAIIPLLCIVFLCSAKITNRFKIDCRLLVIWNLTAALTALVFCFINGYMNVHYKITLSDALSQLGY